MISGLVSRCHGLSEPYKQLLLTYGPHTMPASGITTRKVARGRPHNPWSMGCDVAPKARRGTAVVGGSPFWGEVGLHHGQAEVGIEPEGGNKFESGIPEHFCHGGVRHGTVHASIEVLADMVSQPLQSARISVRIWPGGGISLSCTFPPPFSFFSTTIVNAKRPAVGL